MNIIKKTLTITFGIGICLFSEQIIQACSDFNNYDTYPQFFGNTAYDKPAFSPFNFVEGDLYYFNYWHLEGENEVPSEQAKKQLQTEEWQDFSKKEVLYKDIYSFLYDLNFESKEDIKVLSLKNTFAQFLLEKKHSNVLDYWLFAKKCESNALINVEDWEDNKSNNKSILTNEQLKQLGLDLIKKEKNDFLRIKYAFQILRMSFYDKKYDEVLQLFEELIPSDYSDKSIAYARCLGFKAGAYYRKGKKVEAAYWYSKMFDVNDANKYEAMLSFEWARYKKDENGYERIEDRINKILGLCKSNHERAVVKVMEGLRAYPELDLQTIQAAYKLDPEVKGIDVLINREINKLESKYFMYAVYGTNTLEANNIYYENRPYEYFQHDNRDSLDKIYLPYIQKLNSFLDVLIADNKAGTPALWHLSKAYLACMQRKPDMMQTELDKASSVGMNASEASLHKVIDILNTLYKSKKLTTQIEAEILPKLKSLDNTAKMNAMAGYQFRDIMNNLVAGKYLQQGDTAKAIYAMGHAEASSKERQAFFSSESFLDRQGSVLNTMSIPELKKVQAFRNNPKHTDFEKWLVLQTYYTPKVLTELEGTKYIRNYDFKNAAKIFEQRGISDEVFGNPFMPQIKDIIELKQEDTIRKFTKLSFSKRMAELQDIIAKDPNDAGALYGYAVALYNISYYGKEAEMTYYFRSSVDNKGYYKENDDVKMPREMQEYYRVYTAEQYFNKAAMASKDPEMKAKALWGAAKCWTKRCDINNPDRGWSYDPRYYKNALNSPYFVRLKKELNTTQYMQKVKVGCDYYSDYLKQGQ
ncbi:MAG TPA: hypothetical protein PKX92_09075 [Edaphocola sp.]|nr:hypothetical protein [Edaphocola sp.]